MEHARIFKLEGPITVSSSFEEAFGEYSNMSARRKARILKRNKDRQEVVAARAETRRERIKQRGLTQQSRIAKRTEAQAARQNKRQLAMEARQRRRTSRKELQDAREKIGEEQDPMLGTPTDPIEDAGDTSYSTPRPGRPGGTGGYDPNESQGGEGGYPPSQPRDDSEDSPMGEYETTERSDEDENYGSGEDEEGSGADGIMADGGNSGVDYEDLGPNDEIITLEPDDFYSYMDDYASVDGTPARVRGRIGSNIKSIAVKSEWNKEKASRLKNKINQIESILNSGNLRTNYDIGKNAKMLSVLKEQYVLSKDRAMGFDGVLSEYCNAEGDYYDEDGDYAEANGRPAKKKKKAEVMAAKREARKLRVKSRLANKISKKYRGLGETAVDKSLGPDFDNQRITIPAADLTTGADGSTGLIALDDSNDLDAPSERVIDIKLGVDGDYSEASGGTGIKKYGGLLLGALVIGIAYMYGKKKKLF